MGLSIWHLLVVALVILVLFGRGRISDMMGDFGKGIKSFKEGMKEDDEKPLPPRLEDPDAANPPRDNATSKSADDQPTGN